MTDGQAMAGKAEELGQSLGGIHIVINHKDPGGDRFKIRFAQGAGKFHHVLADLGDGKIDHKAAAVANPGTFGDNPAIMHRHQRAH